MLTFEITTYQVLAPEDPSGLVIPRNPPREVRRNLGISPHINSRHRSIRRKTEEIVDKEATAWEQLETIYDWVRDNIETTNEPLKGQTEPSTMVRVVAKTWSIYLSRCAGRIVCRPALSGCKATTMPSSFWRTPKVKVIGFPARWWAIVTLAA